MEKKDFGIIYMGTPDFAVEPLRKLVNGGYNIKAVVTVADKPSGRGLKVHSSPVKLFAIDHSIPVLQPLKLSDPEFINELKSFDADLFIVVAFRKLPEIVWRMPPEGCFNLHASLLPQYRGAAPINHAVINGETTTGVTTFFINNEIDAGNIIMQKETHIGPDETAGELHDRLMLIGADLVVDTVEAIINGTYRVIVQPDLTHSSDVPDYIVPDASGNQSGNLSSETVKEVTEIKKAPKIFRDDCKINWHNHASTIHNFIRGLSPYPGAFSILLTSEGEKELKVLKSALNESIEKSEPGSLIIDRNRLFVSCQDAIIELLTIQPAGKKSMSAGEFLRGNRIELFNMR